jgi:hypothetical protein
MLTRKLLRRFGYKTDQEGIINRYLREEGGWNEHLEQTKNFILQAADNKQNKSIVVLGSGWLLDVPIEKLSEKFEKVVLADVAHPRQIEHKVKKMPNVQLLNTDVTGLVEPIYETLKKRKKQKVALSDIQPEYDNQLITEIENADFIVSVNLLNQLDILICDYINKFKLYSKEEISLFRKQIQTNHIQLLPANKSALITDYEELNLDEHDKIIKRKRLVHIDLPNEKQAVKWKWSFDLKKTYHTNCKTVFKVMAVEI